MTTKSQFLEQVRLRLDDVTEDDDGRWSDTELNAYLVTATYEYSKTFPRIREQEFEADGIETRYDAPTDLIDDQIQKVTLNDPLRGYEEEIPHKSLRRRGSTRYYECVDDTIIFAFPPNGDVIVRYAALHTMPDSGNSSVPMEDEDLIYAHTMATAWQRIGGNDAALSRWDENGKRDDSPLIPQYVRMWARYRQLVDQKLSTPRFYKRVRVDGNWRV